MKVFPISYNQQSKQSAINNRAVSFKGIERIRAFALDSVESSLTFKLTGQDLTKMQELLKGDDLLTNGHLIIHLFKLTDENRLVVNGHKIEQKEENLNILAQMLKIIENSLKDMYFSFGSFLKKEENTQRILDLKPENEHFKSVAIGIGEKIESSINLILT